MVLSVPLAYGLTRYIKPDKKLKIKQIIGLILLIISSMYIAMS